MKHKYTHYIYASFAFLLFVTLGYMVKFYPEALTEFDSSIQTRVRGDLPAGLTRFFKTITIPWEYACTGYYCNRSSHLALSTSV